MKKHLKSLMLALLVVPCLLMSACGGGATHTHAYGTEWQKDATQHWQTCSCGELSTKENHTWNSGVILTGNEATFRATGTKTFTCTNTGCGATTTETVANSLSTFEELNDKGLYSMEYKEDYKFDEFLEVGASSDTELASFLQNELLDGLPVDIKAPGAACSTFSGELAGSGDRIFARNFDFTTATAMIVKTSPQNGYKSISTVNLGFVGYTNSNLPDINDQDSLLSTLVAPYIPLDGVNEKGLAIGVLQINYYPTKQVDSSKINITTTTMIRLILDKAASVDEAVALMKQYNMNDSLGANFHYQIADKSGKSVVVEYFNNQMKIVDQKVGDNYHFATNYLLHPDAAAAPKAGVDRYNDLKAALLVNGGVFTDEQDAMDLLESVEQSAGSLTQWSVVYNLEKLTTMFVHVRQYTEPALYFSL